MSVFRYIFFLAYNPPGRALSGSAFTWGLRYDARFAAGIGLGILILCAFPILNPFKNFKAKRFWNSFLPILFLIIIVFYGADFYYYDYLHTRLSASVLGFLQDAGISGKMMWQTYPVIRIILVMILLVLVSCLVFGRLLHYFQTSSSNDHRLQIPVYIIAVLVLAQTVMGKLVYRPGLFPLRWSDAYEIGDDYKANLALNPLQSFFSTLSFTNSKPDLAKTREHYPLMADFLGVKQPDSVKLNFERIYPAVDSIKAKPNIVLVICESFSAYKSSMWGNPLNPTPYFNELCSKGLFYDRCFTPSYGTARGVWSTVTGIPDVESYNSTASRNSANVDQRTIINDFTGYDKMYFIGGSASWANLRGLLTNNINGLRLYEQQDYKSSAVDVWGISDKKLFYEANEVLKQQQKPFFAIIQTADNHRPYTIPDEDRDDFKLLSFPDDSLYKYGFQSNAELNAFRFTDFCYQQFIEQAKKEAYLDNTIFVFIGDHGIRGNAGGMLPKAYTEQGLVSEHVPLLFYSPKYIKPFRSRDICSQLDVLPSIASIANTGYHNYTMGRDLFYKLSIPMYLSYHLEQEKAFIFDPDEKTIGMITDEYYFRKNRQTGKEFFVPMYDDRPFNPGPATDSIKNHLKQLTDAYYETARYMLKNNKK
jgi:phosphoglycerol transferase MdoB-like AlkP superfamily enzyme